MLVTELGIVMLPRLVHPENARLLMLVTELGIITLSRLVKLSALSPILV